MSVARWISVAGIVAGALLGSAVDTWRVPPPVQAGGYFVIAADFHVHAFPGDGALPRWELAREASRRGLHAIVISNHNQTLAPKILPGLFSGEGREGPRLPVVIPSQEVTTPGFHLVAAGVTRTIDWRLAELHIVRDIHAQGGVVIAAHPVARFWKGSDALSAVLDGAEVAHPLTTMVASGREELTAFFTRARAVNPTIAPIGSSDFHMVAPLASNRTYVFAESVSVEGVLDAVRRGRTVAEDQDGARYGDPAFTRLLDRVQPPAPPPARRLASLSALFVLLGLVGMVIWR